MSDPSAFPKARRKRAEDKVAQHRAALEQKKRAIMERLLTEEMAEVTTCHDDAWWKTVMCNVCDAQRAVLERLRTTARRRRARWCGVASCVAAW